MARLKVAKSSPLCTIQDKGRHGYRAYGVPQSGAMDLEGMKMANQIVGNDEFNPVIEFALTGIELETLEESIVGVYGASLTINDQLVPENSAYIRSGDLVKLSAPHLVYAYLSVSGLIEADFVFNSFSTYLPGKFGGFQGRSLIAGDEIIAIGKGGLASPKTVKTTDTIVRFMKGPEWSSVAQPFQNATFEISNHTNRIGIKLIGAQLSSSISEIQSSAVIPGTIQLPSSGQLIVLMNDCQTTGGYPRIGKVLDEDLGKLAQKRPRETIFFELME